MFYYNLDYYPQPAVNEYAEIKQSFSTLPNWHCLKALVIGSDTLPVVEEFLPIPQLDFHLVHYETEEYKKRLADMNIAFQTDGKGVFKKNTERILTVYCPLSSQAGDTRSCVIHTMNDIDDGHFIEMLPAPPIREFNIWVKWVDTYGNIHPLLLQPGLNCDIRLCFFKKKQSIPPMIIQQQPSISQAEGQPPMEKELGDRIVATMG